LETEQEAISEKARRNLEENAKLREEDSMYFNPRPGVKYIQEFDPEKRVNKVPGKQFEKDKPPSWRYEYVIVNPENSHEQIWTVSKRTSELIDKRLGEGHRLLSIKREGSGTETRYDILPVD
jgi:hypothetical protein